MRVSSETSFSILLDTYYIAVYTTRLHIFHKNNIKLQKKSPPIDTCNFTFPCKAGTTKSIVLRDDDSQMQSVIANKLNRICPVFNVVIRRRRHHHHSVHSPTWRAVLVHRIGDETRDRSDSTKPQTQFWPFPASTTPKVPDTHARPEFLMLFDLLTTRQHKRRFFENSIGRRNWEFCQWDCVLFAISCMFSLTVVTVTLCNFLTSCLK